MNIKVICVRKKTIKSIISYNIKPLLLFEIIYKLATTIIFIPFFLLLFHLATWVSGYKYLTLENAISFLTNPLVLVIIFILLLLLTFYILIDISTIIIILDSSYHSKKIRAQEALMLALQKARAVFKWKNLPFIFLVIFLIPFLNIGITSSFITTIKIPEFILDFIFDNKVLMILYVLLVIFLIWLLFRFIYVIHYFVLEDLNFKEAKRRSINLGKKSKIKDFLTIMLTQVGIGVAYVLSVLLGIILIMGIYKLMGKVNIFGNLSITIIWLFMALSFMVMTILSTPISYAIISLLFYRHLEAQHETIKPLKIKGQADVELESRSRFVMILASLLVIGSGMVLTFLVATGNVDLKIEHLRKIEVTAHRGASAFYPENTMAAFVGAKEMGADWIELDVQQTKDKKIIVLHDTNLRRTTGESKNTWETDYEEIQKLDAGSFFSTEFADERIPLLEDVIKYAKDNNLKLNIELKPTGHETDFEKYVIDIIRKYDYADLCVVTSQVYDVLKNVKEYDPDITTVYVMSLAYGDITKLEYADNYSIEASSITKTLVDKVHNKGRSIYAWTINTEENIARMIDLDVDNIITDDINLAKETIYSSKTSNVIQDFIAFIERIFK